MDTQNTERKLSQKALKSVRRRHNWALQFCNNYERLQASGFAYAMVPAMKELYDTPEEQCRNLERHLQFYNSHHSASALIIGSVTALEEQGQSELVNSIKLGLMGPLAGIGDTLQYALLSGISSMIAAGLAAEGSWLSVPVIVLPMIFCFLIRWPLFDLGYKKSIAILEDVSEASMFDKIQKFASVLGLMVIGGFIPSILQKLQVTLSYTKEITDAVTGEVNSQTLALQEIFDSILPCLLPAAVAAFAYWLIKTKKVKPLRALLIIGVIAFVLGVAGILGV